MGLEVYWLQLAEDRLNDIYSYYRVKAGKETTKKLINGIVDATKEGIRDGEIIAVVEDSDSLNVKSIESAWRADPQSGKIEVLTDFSGINCLNEEFKGEPAQISLSE